MTAQPEWRQSGTRWVLRIGGEPHYAIPNGNRRSARRLTVYMRGQMDPVCYLNSDQVRGWLIAKAKSIEDAKRDAADGHAYRLARIAEYLSKRAARPRQLALF